MAVEPGSQGSLTYNPWDDFGARYPEWRVRHVPLHGLHEVLCRRRRVILLELTRVVSERRCDLAHAMAHLDLGHMAYSRRDEAFATQHSARQLIALPDLADAWKWAACKEEVAELLRVDLATLQARLDHLHPTERHFLRRAVAENEVTP